tara:strand:+ start:12095 stop:12253 length:159 start_codon:yes stop_codon:yes gene_type:complete
MLANVCYAVWEIGRNAKTKRLKPSDFIPDYKIETQREKAAAATAKLRAFFEG